MKKNENSKVVKGGATVRVILYKSKVLATGEHPLMLCITQNRKRKYLSLSLSCKPELWSEKTNKPKPSHPQKDLINKIIAEKIKEYTTAITEFKSDGKEFTNDTLLNAVEQPTKKTTLHQYFNLIIERLETTNRIKYALSFKDTLRVLKHFKKEDIPFGDITVKFCNDFETYLRKQGLKETSISIYFRTLRVAFNEAIKEKLTKPQYYPFKDYKVSKFDTRTRKRAITKDDKNQIESLNISETLRLYRSRQFFLFSYYVRGINFIDIANLKWSNIEGERLHYVRSKTGQLFNIKLLPQAQSIIDYWKPITYKGQGNDYVFPILDHQYHNDPKKVQNRLHKVLGQTNQDLKEIGQMSGLDIPLTMYVARHTYATTLKHQGVSISKISEAMGHQTEAITRTYLKAFEDDVLDESDKLL